MERIAQGRTAEIFAWGDGKILKLFRPGFDGSAYEAQMAQAVIASGMDAPKLFDLVTVDDRRGIVYEYIPGETMRAVFEQKPLSLLALAAQFAATQAHIHSCTAPQLPSLKAKLRDKIQQAAHLDPTTKAAVLAQLTRLPEGDALCHGDYHPDNLLLNANGAKVIDWVDAAQGNPLADVARTYILLTVGDSEAPLWLRMKLGIVRRIFVPTYLRQYFALRGGTFKDIRLWLAPVAAGRLSEDIPQPAALVALVKHSLNGG
ncbi:MAG: phosphotransferase [Armatimonadetes bacterium]|nr:phosphotransferase [Anaerolineae bacterium]